MNGPTHHAKSATSHAGASPPVPPRRPVDVGAHGDRRIDDYSWLSDRDDPEVLAYLESENAYTEAALAHLRALRDELYAEMVARIQETDLSVPVRKGPWLYYSRTIQGRNYALHCRRPATRRSSGAGPGGSAGPGGGPGDAAGEDAGSGRGQGGASGRHGGPVPAHDDEQVLLDENLLAEGHEHLSLGTFDVSPDHCMLAYSVDTTGGERFELRFRDLTTGNDIADVVANTSYGTAWGDDGTMLYYVRPDEAMRPFQVWRHRVATDSASDVLVLQEDDERFFVGVGRTRDDAYVVVDIQSKVTSEVHVLPCGDVDAPLRVIEPRRDGIEYSIDHHPGAPREASDGLLPAGGVFLVLTNDGAENFRLAVTPDEETGRENWRDIVPGQAEVRIEHAEAFAGHVVVHERADAETRLRVIDVATAQAHLVAQPEHPSTIAGTLNPEFATQTYRYVYTSLVTPASVFDYDVGSRHATLRKRQPVLGDFDASRYRTSRLWARADDGARVPISIVSRTDRAEPGPLLLYGYGSYEISIDPSFSSLRLSLLDRGFAFAIAHVRGGGEMGRHWYEDGKLLNKRHTFTDFLACARHLVEGGWTTPGQLAARGGSAGGLLIGAVANLAPEAFAALVAEVPFVDCLTTILDESLPLTVTEWEEWGNPVDDPAVYAYMKTYSPYDNVRDDVTYPKMFVTAGLNDPRVAYWEPAKWVARMRAANPANDVVLKTELGAGHQGPSGRYDAWRDEALIFAFLLDALSPHDVPGPARQDTLRD